MEALRIIDTHQHLWDTRQFSYSWLRDFPTLDRPHLLEDYAEVSQGANVVKTVYVDTDVDEIDMVPELKWILELAEQPETMLAGVVACAKPESNGFKGYIETFSGHPKLKGIRRVLHTQPDELSSEALFRENIKSLPGYALSFDICAQARQLPFAVELVGACPEVSFILDHCGGPNVKDRALEPWASYIAELAKHPNVACKISGIVASADPKNWKAEDLRPFIEHCIASFGWDRVMWGSDWPVCTLGATYSQWLEAALLITGKEGEENRHKLFHDNAERIYRL